MRLDSTHLFRAAGERVWLYFQLPSCHCTSLDDSGTPSVLQCPRTCSWRAASAAPSTACAATEGLLCQAAASCTRCAY